MAYHGFDEFYRQFYPWVKAYAAGRSSPDPDEIAQLTLMRVYERWDTFDPSSPWSWLQTVAERLIVDASRKRKHEDFGGLESVPLPTPPHEDPAELVVLIDRARLLREAMQEVRPHERKVITRRFLEEATFDELSQEFGVSYDAVRQRVCRAIQRLKPYATKRGIVAIPLIAAICWLLKLLRRQGTPAQAVVGASTLVLAVGIGAVIASPEDSERAHPEVTIQESTSFEPSTRAEIAARPPTPPSVAERPLPRQTGSPPSTARSSEAAPSALPQIEASVDIPPPDAGPGKKESHSVEAPLPVGDVVTYNEAYTTGHILDPACQNGIDACGQQP